MMKALLQLTLLLLTTLSWSMPAQVVIIRHAEKNSKNGLSERGEKRAKLLPIFFSTNPIVDHFGSPVAIYAMATKEGSSHRAVDTVYWLSNGPRIHIPVLDQFRKKDFDQMAKEVMNTPAYNGKTVVICWEHNAIPDMLRSFNDQQGPTSWSDDVFDRAWVIRYVQGDIQFFDVPQHLIEGDSSS